ncbi:MAG: hypothetical protein ACOC9R_01360 [bacterium]
MTEFRVFTFGDTFVVFWLENGLGRKVTARRAQRGATYSREVAPGQWRSRRIEKVRRVRFTEVRQLSSLVRLMMTNDTFPKV